jgi:predicted Zn-dependent peptidase
VKRCCQLVRRELDKLINSQLSQSQLKKAKQQLHGQLAIAADNREQFALDFARNFLHHGTERNLEDILRHIDAITTEELQQVASQLFCPSQMITLVYQ